MGAYRTPAERSVEIAPSGGFSALRQECLAEVVRWRDQGGTVTTYRYDEHGRLSVALEQRAHRDGSSAEWEYRCEYDATGSRTRIVSHREGRDPTIAPSCAACADTRPIRTPRSRWRIDATCTASTRSTSSTMPTQTCCASCASLTSARTWTARTGIGGRASKAVAGSWPSWCAASTTRRAGLGLPVVLWAPVDEIEQMAAFEPAWAPLLRSATRAMRRAEDRDELGRVHDQVRWVPTIATAGRAAVEALWAELAEDAAPPLRLPRRAPADRAALLELLPAAGLERVAGTAIVLVPGSGRSMLGGVPALPAGMAWPHREQGRPLTPLAAIDCGELPSAVQGRELLPADGTLLLFADLWVDAGGYEEELGWGR